VGIFAATLPLQAGAAVALAANRALNRLYPDLLYLIADSLSRLVAVPAMAFGNANVQEVAALHVFAALLSLPVAVLPLRRLILQRNRKGSNEALRWREFVGLMTGQSVASAVWAAARRSDTLAVASFVGPRAAGSYRIALLLASTGAVLQSAAQPIFVPLSTRDLIIGGREAILRRFRTVSRLTLLLSAPVFAVCLASRSALIGAFGQEPGVIEASLVVLCFGFAADCAAGPGTAVLVVAGRSWRASANIGAAFVAEIMFLILLVPPFGPVGAAVSLGLTFAAVEALQLWSIRRFIGTPVVDPSLSSLVILVSLLLVVSLIIGSSPLSWVAVIELGGALVLYVWLSLRFAVSKDDLTGFAQAIRRVLAGR
jgi:O-antigen/teichoic acid export membrane protein